MSLLFTLKLWLCVGFVLLIAEDTLPAYATSARSQARGSKAGASPPRPSTQGAVDKSASSSAWSSVMNDEGTNILPTISSLCSLRVICVQLKNFHYSSHCVLCHGSLNIWMLYTLYYIYAQHIALDSIVNQGNFLIDYP